MALKYTNNASTTLSADITTSATSITVADASEFPTIGAGDYTYITFATADATKIEVVKVTARSGNNFTVTRGQDNTTAQAFGTGDLCELRITSALLQDALESIVDGISDRKDYTVGTTALPYTGSTTVFPVSYDLGQIDVFLNGIHLDPSDFTATNNTSITIGSAASIGDVVSCIGWGTFKLVNMVVSDLSNVSASSPSSGQFLIYNSTTSKWEAGDVDALPSQTSHNNKYLKTNGTTAAWATVDALPGQSGQDGKYLTTSSGSASWAALDTDANTTTKGLYEMANTISSNYSITSGNNALTAGPITINTGISVTIPTGSTWVIA